MVNRRTFGTDTLGTGYCLRHDLDPKKLPSEPCQSQARHAADMRSRRPFGRGGKERNEARNARRGPPTRPSLGAAPTMCSGSSAIAVSQRCGPEILHERIRVSARKTESGSEIGKPKVRVRNRLYASCGDRGRAQGGGEQKDGGRRPSVAPRASSLRG
ncbi:hypothetical protein BD311DRAFT_758259 [Dichomitus squalens]|uniref:Uncharacterized protein n=1 Tax=Dichomitus squalens TaxID=114155 RepID=A0A4V2K0D3_9APHY|nr:hypothetical protein BD311DRAFT_758259 [Dichomitus squalens]